MVALADDLPSETAPFRKEVTCRSRLDTAHLYLEGFCPISPSASSGESSDALSADRPASADQVLAFITSETPIAAQKVYGGDSNRRAEPAAKVTAADFRK